MDRPPRNWPPTSSMRGHLAPLEMQENFLVARAPPRTLLVGQGWLPLSKDLTPAPLPLTRNRRLGPSQHVGLDLPMLIVSYHLPAHTVNSLHISLQARSIDRLHSQSLHLNLTHKMQ